MDAGHYIPKTAGLSIYFHEKNVHAQCTGCNRFRHGNLSQYALALQRKYGGDILSLLDAARRTQRKIKEYEYEQLIEHYKAKLAEIEEARGMCEAADAEMRENPREETKDTAA